MGRAGAVRARPTRTPGTRSNQAQAVVAKRICAACPVRAKCLEYALSGADTWRGITTGIWGGTTPRERSRLRQARKAAAA